MSYEPLMIVIAIGAHKWNFHWHFFLFPKMPFGSNWQCCREHFHKKEKIHCKFQLCAPIIITIIHSS